MAATGNRAIDRWSTWVNVWTGLSLPAVVLAVVAWGPVVVLTVAVVVATMTAIILLMIAHDGGHETRPSAARVRGWSARIVLCAAAMVISSQAWLAVLPVAVLVIVLLAIATSPPALDVVRRHLRRTSVPPPAPSASAPAGPESLDLVIGRMMFRRLEEAAHAMPDPELCRAWRQSYWSLLDATTPAERLAVVLQRQSFLDEFEVRHGVAFRSWLWSGARASSGPDHFLADATDATDVSNKREGR